MIILEKNAKLTTMLAYAKEHIDLGDLDPAANVLRKIGEHMAKWMIIDAGLWTEACTGKNGKVYDDPTFSRCIDLLFRKHRIDKKAYTEVFAPLQNYGNVGSHKVAAVEDYQIIYTFRNVEDYVTKVFLPKYPNASRIDILPDTKNNQPAKKTSPQQTNTLQKPVITATVTPKATTSAASTPKVTKPPAHVHTRSSWKTVRQASCSSYGEEQVVCTTCGAVLERRTTPKAPHKVSNWIIGKNASQYEAGYRYRKCLVCGEYLAREAIPPLPAPSPSKPATERSVPLSKPIQKTETRRKNRKRKKAPGLMIGVLVIILALLLGGLLGARDKVLNLFTGKSETKVVSTSDSKRLNYLEDTWDYILYADLFDLDGEGAPELICVAKQLLKEAKDANKPADKIDDNWLDFCIIYEDDGIRFHLISICDVCHYDLPFGIYLNSHDNKYYLGYAGGSNHYGDNHEVIWDPYFAFYQVGENRLYKFTADEIGTSPVVSWFQLVKEYPFDEQTTDFSAFAYTREAVKQQILAEPKDQNQRESA